MVVFLAPFDQAAFEIGLRFGKFFERQVVAVEPVDQKAVDEIVSLIEIDGAHHGFEGISVDVFLGQGRAVSVQDDKPVESDLPGDRIERLPRYDFRPQFGHEPFVAVGKFDVEVIGCDGFDDGVSEVFEPFVVDLPAVLQYQRSRLVNQSQLVEFDVVRDKTEQIVDRTVECPVGAEIAPPGA